HVENRSGDPGGDPADGIQRRSGMLPSSSWTQDPRSHELHVDRQSFLAVRFRRLLLYRRPPGKASGTLGSHAVQPNARLPDIGAQLASIRCRFGSEDVDRRHGLGLWSSHRRIPVLLERGGELWPTLRSRNPISSRKTSKSGTPSTPTIRAVGQLESDARRTSSSGGR